MFRKSTVPIGCPVCNRMEAERLGNAVEPGTDAIIGSVYGCLRCRTKFSVIGGSASAFGNVTLDLVAGTPDPAPAKREESPLVQRDPDMRWDRSR